MITRTDTSARRSKIVTQNDNVYLCGEVGERDGGVTDQTPECLRRIDDLLLKAGSSRSHILQAIVWLSDMTDFDAMNEVWDFWVPEGHAPARTCGEAKLAHSDLTVEIIITAALTKDVP